MEEKRLLLRIDFSTASESLIQVILDESPEPAILEEIVEASTNRPDILRLLIENPGTPEAMRKKIADTLRLPASPKDGAATVRRTPEERSQTLLQRIQKLSVSEKIQLALRAGKEVRALLLRDTNKEVSLTVIDNPKITETEIELIAKSRSLPDEALRKISKKREWMKNYNIIYALVTNPKTPAGISFPLVALLKTRDLSLLAKNKNVSEGIRSLAKKLFRARQAH